MSTKQKSKHAPKSAPKPAGKESGTDLSYNRIIPLNRGRHAYISVAGGKTLHLATDSEEFRTVLASLALSVGTERVAEWLHNLGWDEHAATLRD